MGNERAASLGKSVLGDTQFVVGLAESGVAVVASATTAWKLGLAWGLCVLLAFAVAVLVRTAWRLQGEVDRLTKAAADRRGEQVRFFDDLVTLDGAEKQNAVRSKAKVAQSQTDDPLEFEADLVVLVTQGETLRGQLIAAAKIDPYVNLISVEAFYPWVSRLKTALASAPGADTIMSMRFGPDAFTAEEQGIDHALEAIDVAGQVLDAFRSA